MGCAERKAAAAATAAERVDDATRAARREACRACEFSTKNPARLDRPTRGLTDKSVCLRILEIHPDRPGNIAVGTAMPKAYCPDGKWPTTPEANNPA